MVVDPNKYDVSEFREGGIDDTSNSGDDNHGFVWVRNETEVENQGNRPNHRQSNENHTSSQSQPQSESESQSREKQAQSSSRKITSSGKNNVSEQTTRNTDEKSAHQQTEENEDNGSGFQWSNTTDTSSSWTQPQSQSDSQSQSWSQSQEQRTRTSEEWSTNGSNNDTLSNTETHNDDISTHQHTENTDDEQHTENTEDVQQEQQYPRTAINPINYDIAELRAVSDCDDVDHLSNELETKAHGFVWSEPPEEHRTRIEDPTPEQYRRLLTLEGVDPEMIGEKPYLTRVSTEAAGAFISDWLEFLTYEAGTEGAINAIERYQEIGWFTKSVEENLQNRIRWIDHYDGNGYKVFDRGDHLLSFAYIAKIASINSKGMLFY